MLEQLLNHLHNFFVVDGGVHTGAQTINDNGELAADYLQSGQYYFIKGSIFNDGLHRCGYDALTPETWTGEIWAMAVPAVITDLADEIETWRTANPETDKSSESFGGYSYTRANANNGAPATWEAVFRARLNPWRKMP